MKKAILLCSGGLDSAVTAYYLKNKLKYRKLILLFFDYGQRTVKQERKSAGYFARCLNAEFKEIKISEIKNISNSLINKEGATARISRRDLKDTKKESDKWYVPCRNIIFLSYALSLAESLYDQKKEVYDIFVGFKDEGKEGFPDASQSFLDKFNDVSRIACKKDFRIIAPLINKDKEDIVLLGKEMKVKLENTFSCYSGEGNEKHCGYCLACKLRQEGFYWANVEDKTKYGQR